MGVGGYLAVWFSVGRAGEGDLRPLGCGDKGFQDFLLQ